MCMYALVTVSNSMNALLPILQLAGWLLACLLATVGRGRARAAAARPGAPAARSNNVQSASY